MTEDRTTGAGTGAAIAVLVVVVIAAVVILAGYLYLTRDSEENRVRMPGHGRRADGLRVTTTAPTARPTPLVQRVT